MTNIRKPKGIRNRKYREGTSPEATRVETVYREIPVIVPGMI